MIGRLVAALVMLATPSVALAQSEWFVVSGQDRSCEVVDTVLPGYGKLAGPYATQEEAIAERERLARCEEANTDPDPDGDGPAPAR